MFTIGLTGDIATGKSTVSRMLGERGALVIDSDALTRELMQPGTPTYRAVVACFGDGILCPDGRLNRAALGQIVFSEPARLRELESLVHPAVAALREAKLRASDAEVAVIEAVKLVEAGQHEGVDELWVVTSTREVQLRRLLHDRGLSLEDAERRLAAQPPTAAKLKLAAVVLQNNGTLAQLRAEVERQWRRLTE